MTDKHTPWPWHFHPQSGYFPRVYIGGDVPEYPGIVGHYISVNACHPGGGTETHEANARLIAAAPDLLAALDDIVNGENWRSGRKFDPNSGDFDLSIQRAAIAKARGQA